MLRLGKEYVPQRCELCGDREALTSKIPDPSLENEVGDLVTVWACAKCKEAVRIEKEEEDRKKKQLAEVEEFMEEDGDAVRRGNPFGSTSLLFDGAEISSVSPFRRPPSAVTEGPTLSTMIGGISSHLGIPSSELLTASRDSVMAVLRVIYQRCTSNIPDRIPEGDFSNMSSEFLHDMYVRVTRCHRNNALSRSMLEESLASFRRAQTIIPDASWSSRIVRMSYRTFSSFAAKVGMMTLIDDFDAVMMESIELARSLVLWHLNATIPVWREVTVDLRQFTPRERQVFSSAITGSASTVNQPFSYHRVGEIWRYCIVSLRLRNVIVSPGGLGPPPLDEVGIMDADDWLLYYWAEELGVERSRAYDALSDGGVEFLRTMILTAFQNRRV